MGRGRTIYASLGGAWRAAVFDRSFNGWITVPAGLAAPDDPQDRDMLARELLIKFQMSRRHPPVQLREAFKKF